MSVRRVFCCPVGKENVLRLRLLVVALASLSFSAPVFCGDDVAEEYKAPEKADLYAGDIHAVLDGRKGSLGLFLSPGSGSERSVLSTLGDSESAVFSVVVDGREYRMGSPSVKKTISASGSELCKIDFTDGRRFVSSVELVPLDSGRTLEIRFSVINTDGKARKIMMRTMFDTVLGENSDAHFATGTGRHLFSEMQFDAAAMKRAGGIRSSDARTSVAFGFNGLIPNYTIVANRDVLRRILGKRSAVPRAEDGRSFSGVNSLSNSALAFFWGPFVLEPGVMKTVSVVVSMSDSGEAKSSVEGEAMQEDDSAAVEEPPAAETPVPEEKGVSEGAQQPEPKAEEPPAEIQEKTRPSVDFIVTQVKDYQLDPVYIQGLVDRINALQSGKEKAVDKDEIKRLNAELDAILDKLNSK